MALFCRRENVSDVANIAGTTQSVLACLLELFALCKQYLKITQNVSCRFTVKAESLQAKLCTITIAAVVFELGRLFFKSSLKICVFQPVSTK